MSDTIPNIKSKLEGDELDLSMMRLTDIPVSEIAAIPKATKIDLSNNELASIDPSFANCLSHVTKLDFSSNKLTELPSNFGDLVNLRHLDLYNNKLSSFPLTLSNLQNLRYLDVKNNPLEPEFAAALGDCSNNRECQAAARNLINFLTSLKLDLDQRQILKTRKAKEKAMVRIRQEEEERARERERKKAEKKAAKEKRRQELLQESKRTSQGAGVNGAVVQNGKPSRGPEKKNPNLKKDAKYKKGSGKWSILGIVNMFLLLALVVAAGTCVALYAEGDLSVEGLKAAWPRAKRNSALLLNMTLDALSYDNVKSTADRVWGTVGPWARKVQGTLVLSYNTTKNMAVNALRAAGIEDLTPFVDGVRRLWRSLVGHLLRLSGVAWEWLSLVDWEGLFARGKESAEFMADQFRVLNEDLWRNEAVVSLWEDAKPFREAVWNGTESLRRGSSQLYSHFMAHWWPFITEQTYYLYNSSKKSIESLLQ